MSNNFQCIMCIAWSCSFQPVCRAGARSPASHLLCCLCLVMIISQMSTHRTDWLSGVTPRGTAQGSETQLRSSRVLSEWQLMGWEHLARPWPGACAQSQAQESALVCFTSTAACGQQTRKWNARFAYVTNTISKSLPQRPWIQNQER